MLWETGQTEELQTREAQEASFHATWEEPELTSSHRALKPQLQRNSFLGEKPKTYLSHSYPSGEQEKTHIRPVGQAETHTRCKPHPQFGDSQLRGNSTHPLLGV